MISAVSRQDQPPILPENHRFLREYIQRESGVVLDDSKLYLLQSRLQSVLRDARLKDLDALCSALRATPDAALKRAVIEAILTHETLFFRDVNIFDALRTTVIPELLKSRGAARLSAWSAASSSGQEAYSVAMLLLELGLAESQIDIVGTDLSSTILERARKGRFPQIQVNRGLPTAYLMKYFVRQGLEWQICDSLRRIVRFQQMDLRGSRPGGSFDLVLCRNVLIYFDLDTRKAVLTAIRRAMKPGAVLVLGTAETLLNMADGFARKTTGSCVYYQAI